MKLQPFVYFLSEGLDVATGVHYAAAWPELMHTNDAAAAAKVDSSCGRGTLCQSTAKFGSPYSTKSLLPLAFNALSHVVESGVRLTSLMSQNTIEGTQRKVWDRERNHVVTAVIRSTLTGSDAANRRMENSFDNSSPSGSHCLQPMEGMLGLSGHNVDSPPSCGCN